MKLREEQYQNIESYLNSKGVCQIDLKHEILDHIASGVENNMLHNKCDYQKAFELEQLKWQSELNSFKMAYYNIDFKTPKILLRRYWNVVIRMYTSAIFMGFGLFLCLSFLLNSGMVSMKHLNILLGISYVFVIAGITIAFFQMKVKDADTVDRIIFRATIGYFMAWLIVFNPFVSKMYWVYEEGQFMSVFFFIHTFLLSFSFNFSDLYRGHRKKVKLHLS
jgi:hypothetical protein